MLNVKDSPWTLLLPCDAFRPASKKSPIIAQQGPNSWDYSGTHILDAGHVLILGADMTNSNNNSQMDNNNNIYAADYSHK